MRMEIRNLVRAGKLPALVGAVGAALWALSGCGGGGGGGGSAVQGTLVVKTLKVNLDGSTAALTGAAVFVNGTDTKQTTPAEIHQAAGPAQVVVRLDGYDDASTTANVTPNQITTVELTMNPSRPPDVPPHTITGKVSLSSGGTTQPAPGATVTATETTSGDVYSAVVSTASADAGTYYIFAPAGTYNVTASNAGYTSQTKQVTIISGEDRHTGVDFTLTP